MKNRFNGNYIVDSLKWQVFFQGAESAGCKSLGQRPRSGCVCLGALKARPMYVQGSILIHRNIRAKAVTLRAFSAQLSLLRPPGPLAGLLHPAPSAQHALSMMLLPFQR